jgi:hypothetical protein
MSRIRDRSKSSRPPARQINVRVRELDQKNGALALHAYDRALLITRVGTSKAARKMFVPRSTVQRVKNAETPVNFYHPLRDPKIGVPFIRRFCRKYCAAAKRGHR